MIRIFLPLILAALGFAAASCSQSAAPFAPAETPAPPQPASHGAAVAAAMPTSDPEPLPSDAPAAARPAADPSLDASMPAERRASTLIGMPVVSTQGTPVGQVKDVVFDRQGRATHLVIAYGASPDTGSSETPDDGKANSNADGKLTAMPWDAALASIRDGKLVLDGAKLLAAPSFTPDAWPNLDDPSWSTAADTYWRKAVRAAIAAHPGNPVDSTERQRGRPGRDGDGN